MDWELNTTYNVSKVKVARAWLEFWNRSPATIAVETSMFLLIGLVAIGGNLLVIISIYRNPSLRTITNFFVLSLSITDILYPVLGLPLTLAWSIKSRFILGQGFCDYQAVMITSVIMVSLLNMTLMAYNRFVRVCKPQKYIRIFAKKRAFVMLGVVWVFSFIAVVLYNKVGNRAFYAYFIPEEIRCGFLYNKNDILFKIMGNSILTGSLTIPFFLIVYFYIRIFKKIREHKRNTAPQEQANGNLPATNVREIKITWTVFAVLLGYFLTWIPVLSVTLLTNMSRRGYLPRQARILATYAGVSNCAINPFIYAVMNTSFRREYKKIFGR